MKPKMRRTTRSKLPRCLLWSVVVCGTEKTLSELRRPCGWPGRQRWDRKILCDRRLGEWSVGQASIGDSSCPKHPLRHRHRGVRTCKWEKPMESAVRQQP